MRFLASICAIMAATKAAKAARGAEAGTEPPNGWGAQPRALSPTSTTHDGHRDRRRILSTQLDGYPRSICRTTAAPPVNPRGDDPNAPSRHTRRHPSSFATRTAAGWKRSRCLVLRNSTCLMLRAGALDRNAAARIEKEQQQAVRSVLMYYPNIIGVLLCLGALILGGVVSWSLLGVGARVRSQLCARSVFAHN